MRRYEDEVILVDDEIALRQRLFQKILFLSMVACGACIIVALLTGVKTIEILLFLSIWVCSFALYLNARKSKPHFTEVLFFLAVLTIVNTALYTITKGHQGPTNQVFTVIAMMAIVLFRTRYRYIIAGFYLILQVSLFIVELTIPDFVLNKNQAIESSIFDELLQFILYIVFVRIAIHFKSIYIRQQRVIKEDEEILEHLLWRFRKENNDEQAWSDHENWKSLKNTKHVEQFELPGESLHQIECIERQTLRALVCRMKGLHHLLQINDHEDIENFRKITGHIQTTCSDMEKVIVKKF